MSRRIEVGSRMRWNLRGALFVTSGFVTLLIGEGVARLTLTPPLYIADPRVGTSLRPNLVSRFTRSDVDQVVVTNSHGFHDAEYPRAKPEGVKRVLILGDSFMEALQVDVEETFGQRLQEKLNRRSPGSRIQIVNSGRSGRGTLEEYAVLRNIGFDFEPDLVIQAFCMNDVHDDKMHAGHLTYDDQGRPTGFQTQGISPIPLEIKALMHRSWMIHWSLSQLSIVYREARSWWSQSPWKVPGPPPEATEIAGSPTSPRLPAAPATRAVSATQAIPAAPERITNPEDPFKIARPNYTDETWADWARTQDNLARMKAECEARGVEFMIMVIPLEAQYSRRDTPAIRAWDLDGISDRAQIVLKEFGEREGIPVLDLLPAFSAETAHLDYLEGHWNENGHEVASREAASFIFSNQMLGLAHRKNNRPIAPMAPG